jgi:hypothetical protein
MVSSKNNVKVAPEKSVKCTECFSDLQKRVNLIGITLIVTLVVAVFGAVVGLTAAVETSNNANEISNLQSSVDKLSGEAKQDGIRSSGVSYEGQNDKTALELLKDKYQVDTKEFSGVGEFVSAIEGVAAEDGKNFWAFYVDGQMATEGAGTYKTKDGEKIEWRLDEIQ